MKVGLIGYGSMGRTHGQMIGKHEGVELIAVADAVPEKRELAENELNVMTFADGYEMIDAGGFDVIFVCAPTYLHADLTKYALAAGNHVFCEKPMALNPLQCQSMIEAEERSGKSLLIGQVLRFWPEYVYLKNVIDDGRYGKLNALSMTRLGGVSIGWQNWFLDESRGGMQIFDRHIHDTDAILWMLGTPKQVRTYGVSRDTRTGGGIFHNFTQYIYDDGVIVNAEGSADTPKGFPFTAKYHASFERAILDFDGTRKDNTLLIYDGGEPKAAELPAPMGELTSGLNVTTALPYFYEEAYFFDCLKRGVKPSTVTPQTAMETIRVVRAEIASARSGREVLLG